MQPVRLESRVTEVEVFRSGARVVRRAPLPEGPWPGEVVVDGLPLALEDGTVRVSVSGTAGDRLPWPGDARVELVLPPEGEALLTKDDAELLALGDEVKRLEGRLALVGKEEARLEKVRPVLAPPFANRPPRPAPAAAWRGTLDWLARRRGELLEERLTVADELREARERLGRVGRRIHDERARRDARADGLSKAVAVRLRDGGGEASGEVVVEYQVPGAFWAPSYVVRVSPHGQGASLALRALVAQRSGESWDGVRLSLSTADRYREGDLPDLPSLRIGRRQDDARRSGWRPLPEGYDGLFAGFDAALGSRPRPPLQPQPKTEASRRAETRDERSAEEHPAFQALAPLPPTPPPSPVVPAPSPAPGVPIVAAASAPQAPTAAASSGAGLLGGLRSHVQGPDLGIDRSLLRRRTDQTNAGQGAAEEAEVPPGSVGLEVAPGTLHYADLSLSPWDAAPGERGRLRPRPPIDRLATLAPADRQRAAKRLQEAERKAEDLGSAVSALPQLARPVSEGAEAFDARYAAEGLVDVPSDGRPHLVGLLAREAKLRTLYVAVPREGTDVVRVAVLPNPLRVPLLAGPADVYLGDELLVTTPLASVPAGGEVTLGLGVEESIKVARNVRFTEESHGVLGGGLTLDHRVTIEVASRLAEEVDVEVRDRVPVKLQDDRSVEIVATDVSPAWSELEQKGAPVRGGRKWTFSLAPGASKKLAFRYLVKIDARDELVGGNRREKG